MFERLKTARAAIRSLRITSDEAVVLRSSMVVMRPLCNTISPQVSPRVCAKAGDAMAPTKTNAATLRALCMIVVLSQARRGGAP